MQKLKEGKTYLGTVTYTGGRKPKKVNGDYWIMIVIFVLFTLVFVPQILDIISLNF